MDRTWPLDVSWAWPISVLVHIHRKPQGGAIHRIILILPPGDTEVHETSGAGVLPAWPYCEVPPIV